MSELSEIAQRIQSARKKQGLTQEALARRSGVPYASLIKIERGAIKNPSVAVVSKLARALDISLDSLLVLQTMSGPAAIRELWDDILQSGLQAGDNMCLTGLEESSYLRFDRQGLLKFIQAVKTQGLTQKLLVCEGDWDFLPGDHLEYRWIPKKHFHPTPTYIYGDKVAILIWGKPVQVVVMQHKELAETYRRQFLFAWERALVPRKKTLKSSKKVKKSRSLKK